MTLQDIIWALTLLGVGFIALVFAYIVANAGKPADDAGRTRLARRFAAMQKGWFALLLLGFAVGTWATLRHFPIPPQHGALGAEQTVQVTGYMWRWEIEPGTVRAGSPVEFRVTSADVNHGFGLYAPDGHMLTQTQAMPKYTNRILHTFDEPGTYTVHCLEYCGVGHAPMKATVEVVAASAEED